MNSQKYDAVIFDFFGTLVPNFTLSAHEKILGEVADRVGISLQKYSEKPRGRVLNLEF